MESIFPAAWGRPEKIGRRIYRWCILLPMVRIRLRRTAFQIGIAVDFKRHDRVQSGR